MNKNIQKRILPKDYFSKISIPENWSSLEEFVDWYLEARMPLMVPFNAEVITSDDACAICIFRKGNYQVEFYLEYPEMWIRRHAHPRMEVIVMDLGGGSATPKDDFGVSMIWGNISPKLPAGEFHGGDQSSQLSNGFVTLAFQRWENLEEMSSAAIQWKGELQGPNQAKLIKSKKKNAEVSETYADVTNNLS